MTASSFFKSTLKNGIVKSNKINGSDSTLVHRTGLVLELDVANSNSYSGSGSTWYDLSGENNHATLFNSPTYGKDPYGYLEFNGTNQYAEISPNSNLRVSNTWTVNVWLKWTGTTDTQTTQTGREVIIGNRRVNTPGCFQAEIGIGNDQVYSASVTYPGTWIVSTQKNTIPLEKWINLTWVQSSNNSGGGIDVYLNGIKLPRRYNMVAPVPQQAIADNLAIGQSGTPSTGGQWFAGKISYLSMYNVALTKQEVAKNYNSLKNRFIDYKSSSIEVEHLVIGGGGGGGYAGPGGGGAGGYIHGLSKVDIGSSYQVTVGSGGQCSANSNAAGANGGDSVFGTLTALGGGGGGSGDGIALPTSGGSGGGASYSDPGGTSKNSQGHPGGSSSYSQMSGGGGGAGSAGNSNGDGGFGLSNEITGAKVTYASGGGGYPSGQSFPGGGASNSSSINGTDGLGGGGGGNNGSSYRGGSGVVIIAYPNTYQNITTIPGTLTYTLDTTTRAGYKVYKFTAGSGSITI